MTRNHVTILIEAHPGETAEDLARIAGSTLAAVARAVSRSKAAGSIVETRDGAAWRYEGDVTVRYWPKDGAMARIIDHSDCGAKCITRTVTP